VVGSVDFNSKYKILWGETKGGPWGTYSEEKNKFQSENLKKDPHPL